MARKRHTAEEIVAKLRQVDVLTSQGRPVAEAVRSIGVTEGYILPLAPGVWRAEG
jgi:putative transposase